MRKDKKTLNVVNSSDIRELSDELFGRKEGKKSAKGSTHPTKAVVDRANCQYCQ